jgi:hypothetical protein
VLTFLFVRRVTRRLDVFARCLGSAVLLMASNCLVDLVAMYGHLFRRLDSKAYFVTSNFNDNDRDVVADDDRLVFLPAEN